MVAMVILTFDKQCTVLRRKTAQSFFETQTVWSLLRLTKNTDVSDVILLLTAFLQVSTNIFGNIRGMRRLLALTGITVHIKTLHMD